MSSQHAVKCQSKGRRLNDRQRMEIIALLEQPKPQSMRSIAHQFGIDEKTIRKVKSAKDVIRKRAQNAKQATQETIFRQAMFPELENRLAKWIDAMRQMPLVLSLARICQEAKLIAHDLRIPDDKFKASSDWLVRFLRRHDLKFINLLGGGEDDRFLRRHDLKFINSFGEGGEVDRNKLEVALIESNDKFDGSLSDNEPTEVNMAEIDQKQVILNLKQNVINLRVDMNKLQNSRFLSSDEIHQAKSALSTLEYILHKGSYDFW